MTLPPLLRLFLRIVSLPGMHVWSLLVRAGMRFSRPGSKVSLQAHLLVLALRGYRFWSSLNPRDQVRIRASQNALAARIRTAPGVRFEHACADGVACEWAIPPDDPGDRAILYFHGGGYTTGSLLTHRSMVSYIAAASGLRVLGVDYRLAPEHPHPAAFEDALTAFRWLGARGYPAPKLALAGDSAGGGLAMSLLLHLRDERLRGGPEASIDALPAGAALLSPWVDLTDMKGSWERLAANDWLLTPESLQADARKYLGIPDGGCGDLVDPAVSPRYADMRGIPMLMVHVGGDELLREDILGFVAKARSDGVKVCLGEWAGMFHDWHMLAAYLPEARRAVDEIGTFLKIVLA